MSRRGEGTPDLYRSIDAGLAKDIQASKKLSVPEKKATRSRTISTATERKTTFHRVVLLAGYPLRVASDVISFELSVLQGHLADAEIRAGAALQSRTPTAFFKEQIDLLPETWRRVRHNLGRRQRLLLDLLPRNSA